ncbi:MAG: LacI family DNA-binding transcriptional regulator [Terriglobia bacterium]|jgi:LacI family transcriptional regulator
MVTIREVAKESGFSSTTVSIVLNDAPIAQYIPLKTKTRIKQVAKRLRYRPNVFARSLRSKRSHTVGVFVLDITDPYCAHILRGIEESLYHSSYLPILTDIQNDRGRFERYLELLLDRQVEGLITLANSIFLDIELLAALERRNVPTVIIGREVKHAFMSSVVVDNEAGARSALEHLLTLGHRRIAFIRGPKTLVDSSQRWKGIRAYAQEVALHIDSRLVLDMADIYEPTSSFQCGYALTQELLKRRHSFTALMAFDDMAAFGAIRALSDAGHKVPESCSVIGFDDVAPAAFYSPPLTTMRQPMEGLGSIGVKILLDAVNASVEKKVFSPVHQKVAAELVVRKSTAPLRRS